MVNHKLGNLLDAPVDYVCHQVNCQKKMGSGIAKSIRERWPVVYDEYMSFLKACDMESTLHSSNTGDRLALGNAQLVPVGGKTVINMFAQRWYGYDGQRYTSYDAFQACLDDIKNKVPKGSKIGFPWKIGCGLGGANLQVISTMICEALGRDYDVYIYQLEE